MEILFSKNTSLYIDTVFSVFAFVSFLFLGLKKKKSRVRKKLFIYPKQLLNVACIFLLSSENMHFTCPRHGTE